MQQTNTADMLDLAVQYIKDLQEQVKVTFSHVFLHTALLNILLSSLQQKLDFWSGAGREPGKM